MNCPRCGEVVVDSDARFCDFCGASLTEPAPTTPTTSAPTAATSPSPSLEPPAPLPQNPIPPESPEGSPVIPAAASAGGARCPVHPEASAVEICARCGTFACRDCTRVDPRGRPLCTACDRIENAGVWQIPWERRSELGTLTGFWRTARATMSEPNQCFAGLPPQTGRWWDPLSYALFSNFVVLAVVMALVAVVGALVAVIGVPEKAAEILGIGAAVIAGILVLFPIYVIIRVFVLGGIEHLLLMLLGGATNGFEATLRAHCYSCAPAIFGMIPGCGAYVSEIWQIVLRILGYKAVHRISGGKAAAAVLAPIGLCIGGYVTLLVAIQAFK